MVKHIVMWKLKQDKVKEAKERKKRLERLKDYIDEIKFIEVGINIEKSDSAYDVVLNSEFENIEALNRYINHPKHIEVSDYVTTIRSDRKVVDYIY